MADKRAFEPKPAHLDPLIKGAMFLRPETVFKSGDAIRSMQQNAFQSSIGNPVFSPSLPDDFDSKALMQVIKGGARNEDTVNAADDVYAASEHDEAMRMAVKSGLISQSKFDDRVKGRDISTTFWLEEMKKDNQFAESNKKFMADTELGLMKADRQEEDLTLDDVRQVGWKLAKNKIRKKLFGIPTSFDDFAKDAIKAAGISGKVLTGFGNLTDLTVEMGNAEIGGPAYKEAQARDAARPAWDRNIAGSAYSGPSINAFIRNLSTDRGVFPTALEKTIMETDPVAKKAFQSRTQAMGRAMNYDKNRNIPIA